MVYKYEKNLPPKGILTITPDDGIFSKSKHYYFEHGKFYHYESANPEYNKQFPVKKPRLRKHDDFSVVEWR